MATKAKKEKAVAPKQRKSTKLKEVVVDKEISKLSKALEVITKVYSENGSVYKIYKDIPPELIVDETTEQGRKVMASIYPESHEVYLIAYHKPGLKSFPFGGIRIYNKTLGETKYVYPEAVVKHKDVQYYRKAIEDCD